MNDAIPTPPPALTVQAFPHYTEDAAGQSVWRAGDGYDMFYIYHLGPYARIRARKTQLSSVRQVPLAEPIWIAQLRWIRADGKHSATYTLTPSGETYPYEIAAGLARRAYLACAAPPYALALAALTDGERAIRLFTRIERDLIEAALQAP